MLGKAFNACKNNFSGLLAASQTTQKFDIMGHSAVHGAESLPRKPESAYRKRPVKLIYDKNEYYAFRMPSEKTFLLSSFDSQDLFGKRKGVNQSAHIKAQTDLDNNMLWFIGGITVLATVCEFRPKAQYRALRDNYRMSETIRLTEADLV